LVASCLMRSSTDFSDCRQAASLPREGDLEAKTAQLPQYTRSLLRVEVPVRVTLANARLPLRKVLELAPGSFIPLAKSCSQPLLLSVSNHDVALGEVVKIGDKFGLRITSMVMPRERFYPLMGKKPAPATRGG